MPFALRDTSCLLSEPPPPHLTSGAYAKAYNEVKALGARVGSTRTSEQTDLPLFYSDNFGNHTTGLVITNAEMRGLALHPHAFHGDWNYERRPRPT